MEPKSPGPTSSHPSPLLLPDDTSSAEGAGVPEADRLGGEREWQAQELKAGLQENYGTH